VRRGAAGSFLRESIRVALTEKQRDFVREYLVDLNATQAAIRAKYSPHTARFIGCENLTKPNIQAAIIAARRAQMERTQITADRVLCELARVAFSDPRKLFGANGALKPVTELDDDTAATLAQLEVFEETEGRGEAKVTVGYTKKLKQWDKVSALEKLGKHLGLFTDIHEHRGPGGGPIELIETIVTTRAEAKALLQTVPDPGAVP
jgi:phage terminase small subunit